MNYAVRYDLRNPARCGRSFADVYSEFLRQAEFVDRHGFASLLMHEHHTDEAGPIPCLLTMAAAVAARTSRIEIVTNVVVLSLRHPVLVAEQAALVDVLSRGRLTLGLGGGYRSEEFAAFGIPREERGARMGEALEILKLCWTSATPFDFDGRHWRLRGVTCNPKPVQRPHPKILLGGNSAGAARRAARFADGFIPLDSRWISVFKRERERLGLDPGPPPPPPRALAPPLTLFVSRDPERVWKEIAPHLLYDHNAYATYAKDEDIPQSIVADADQLKRTGLYAVLTPEETIDLGHALRAEHGPTATLTFHPMLGGIPPEIGQETLQLVIDRVMPKLN